MTQTAPLIHNFPPPRRWRSKWVWTEGDGREKNVFCLFRRVVDLEDVPQRALLFIAADTRYQLFVNGTFIGRGAPQSQPYFQYYDEHDVAPLLVEGDNCIAVIVSHVGNLEDTRGGLLAELVDGAGNLLAATNATWRVTRSPAWKADTFAVRFNQATPYQEVFDRRAMPEDWNRAGFSDDGWQQATVVPGRTSDRPPAVAPWIRLVPRDIPFMREEPVQAERVQSIEESLDLINRVRGEDLSIALSTAGKPVEHSTVDGAENLCREEADTVVRCSTRHEDHVFDGVYDPCIVLDFGRVITAYARIELDGVDGGMLDIGYAERLIDGHFVNSIEGQFADRLVMRAGRQSYQPFTWKAFRYLKLRFRSCPEPVIVHAVQAIVTTYPYDEKGRFESNDDLLNKTFEISRYTLRLCSNEFVMDTPWREQAQWLGDVAAVTLGGVYACFGDTALAGKFLRQSGANPTPAGFLASISNACTPDWQGVIPDYSLWWVMWLWNHYLYTGEERWIHELYPAAVRILQAFLVYVNERGLLEDVPCWVFVDWADVDRRGECAAMNAIFYGALEAWERMAGLKGDKHTLARVRTLEAGIKASFKTRFFEPDRGCFVDARVDGEWSPKLSEHTNMAAIYFGLCDDETAGSIISRLYEEKSLVCTEAQPFFTTVILQALDQQGRFDLALDVIRERWGKRMVEQGATSTYEEWGMNGSWRSGEYDGVMRTLSHAWSAHPAEFLINNLMGIQLAAPGCRKLRVAPKKTPFDYEAAYPTPLGVVEVSWKDGEMKVNVPEKIERLK